MLWPQCVTRTLRIDEQHQQVLARGSPIVDDADPATFASPVDRPPYLSQAAASPYEGAILRYCSSDNRAKTCRVKIGDSTMMTPA